MKIGNQLSFYKKINNELLELSQIKLKDCFVSYIENQETIEIDIKNDTSNIIINELDPKWDPNKNNLYVNKIFEIPNPSVLFEENGVADKDTVVGFGCKIRSKEGHFQTVKHLADITKNSPNLEFSFDYNFPVRYLRGNVVFEYFFYVKEVKNTSDIYASKNGMLLSDNNLFYTDIIIDGDGSVFPISEFKEKGGPLWKLKKNWSDPYYDNFSNEYVSLALNTDHPHFSRVNEGRKGMGVALLNTIIAQVITDLVIQIILIEKHDIGSDENTDIMEGSILSAVKYWMDVYEIDATDIFTIQNSVNIAFNKIIDTGGEDID